MEARSCSHCRSGKAKSIIQPECVCVFVALGIQRVLRMRHFIICGVLGSKYFSTLFHKRHDFRKKQLLNTKCVFIFPTTFV